MLLRFILCAIIGFQVVLSSNLLAEENELAVLVITAQKRQQPLQEVPVAVTVINADELDNFSISNSENVAELVPNLNVSRSYSGTLNYFIRGIGMDDFNLSSVPAIGLYLDDVAIHNPLLANFALYDFERIEVLRGPQNTLFGMNTTGGAINFITKKPRQTDDLNGYAKLTVGNYNAQYFDAASNLNIDDATDLRFSMFNHQRQGLVTSEIANNDTEYNNVSRWGLRSQFVHQINPKMALHASLYGGKQNQVAEVKTLLLPRAGTTIIDLDDADLSLNESALIEPPNAVDSLGGYVKFKWQGTNLDFSSITAFEKVESKRSDDWGSQSLQSNIAQIINYHASDTSYYSQEFQFTSKPSASYDWLIGILVDTEGGDILQTAFIDPAGPGRPDDAIDDAGIGPLFDRGAWLELDTSSYSLYGQLSYTLNQRATLTTGYRWTKQYLNPTVNSAGMMMDLPGLPFPLGSFGWYSLGNPNFDLGTDHAGFSVIRNFIDANNGFPATAKIDESFTEWGGKIALDYRLNNDIMMYGYVAQGFKMGSVNSNPTTASFLSVLDKVVQPENLTTYELGAKSQWLANQLRINGSLFYNEWNNYQFYQVYNPGNPANLFASLVNLPKARSYGAEVEMKWLLDNDFMVNLGVGWLDTEVVDGTLNTEGIPEQFQDDFQRQVVAGNKLTNAPEWVYNVSLLKSLYFEASELDLLVHYNYAGEHIHTLAGENSETWQQNFSETGVGLLNLNASYHFGEFRQYKVALWARNVLDEKYCTERSTIPGADTEITRLCVQGEPKILGLTFSYLFE